MNRVGGERSPMREIQRLDEIYHAAARLIERKGWTQGAFARDRDGVPCPYCYSQADSFCVTGAILVVSAPHAEDFAPVGVQVLDNVVMALHGLRLSKWNDEPERTEQDVLNLLKEQVGAGPREYFARQGISPPLVTRKAHFDPSRLKWELDEL